MGNEIVYCIGCSARIGGSALERGNAFRIDDQVACAQCIEELVADLPAEEQQRVLNQHQKPAVRRTTTRNVPIVKSADKTTGRIQKRTTGTVPVSRKTTTGGIKKVTGKVPTQSVRKTGSVPINKATRPMTKRVPKAEQFDEDEEFEDDGDAGSKKKKVLILSLGGGGVLVLLVVVLILLFSGGKKDVAPVQPLARPNAPAAPKPDAAAKSSEAKAKELLLQAIKLQDSNPRDFSARMGTLKQAKEAAGVTPLSDTIEGYIQTVIQDIETETQRIIENVQTSFQNRQYGTVLKMLDDAKAQHDIDEWRAPLDRALAEKKEAIDGRVAALLEAAKNAKARGNEIAVQESMSDLSKWGLNDKLKEFQVELSKVKVGDAPVAAASNPGATVEPDASPDEPENKELSEAVKAYRETWTQAMHAVYGRKYEEAIGRLNQAKEDAGDDDAKKEADADLKTVKAIEALRRKAIGLYAKVPAKAKVHLTYEDFPKEYKEIWGSVLKNHDGKRLELLAQDEPFSPAPKGNNKPKTPPKKIKQTRIIVEIEAIRGSSLAAYALDKGKLSDGEKRAAALLTLVEGEPELAKEMRGGNTRGIASRYWEYGKTATEEAPRPDRLEFQARKLFHGATLEWSEIRSWGTAMEKYRMLNNDFALAKITQQNLPIILKRMGMGKEYLYFPHGRLESSGSFEVKDVSKITEGMAAGAYQNPKDVEEYRAQANYLDFQFYALPDHSYRVWVYAGACCGETFFTYFQSSEYKVREGGETVVLDPGSDFAMPITKMYIRRLKKTHKEHKGEKEPTRWDWIQVPTPSEYQAEGPKGIRLYNDQKGFSVAYALISSSRKKPPTPEETREFVELYKSQPKPKKAEAPAKPAKK